MSYSVSPVNPRRLRVVLLPAGHFHQNISLSFFSRVFEGPRLRGQTELTWQGFTEDANGAMLGARLFLGSATLNLKPAS